MKKANFENCVGNTPKPKRTLAAVKRFQIPREEYLLSIGFILLGRCFSFSSNNHIYLMAEQRNHWSLNVIGFECGSHCQIKTTRNLAHCSRGDTSPHLPLSIVTMSVNPTTPHVSPSDLYA